MTGWMGDCSGGPADEPASVPKILGADVELGNFVEGLDPKYGSAGIAARRLLQEIEGVPADARAVAAGPVLAHDWLRPRLPAGVGPQDWGRRFLRSNAGCAYIDLDHLELAQPETTGAFDFVAFARAMLETARAALGRVNARMPEDCRVVALANCSDGLGHSHGAHVSVLVTRRAWADICTRKPHYLAYLAAFQTSSIVFTGGGKVGSENGAPPAAYQLSQRADFFSELVGSQTTHARPLVNTRDEPLCGPPTAAGRQGLARLHVIFYDHSLMQTATLLKAGTLQIIAAMLEAQAVDAGLALDDPLEALQAWSRDPTLAARALTVAGESLTAVDLQQRFLEAALRFADTGRLDPVVPRAAEILALWQDTLLKLQARDFPALARRLDWVLKLEILKGAMDRRPSLGWASPEIKHLDQIYASLDADDGLYWVCEREGQVERVVTDDAIARARSEPPRDTRAWTRAHLLRLGADSAFAGVDWDRVRVRISRRRGVRVWSEVREVELCDPASATEAEHGALFQGVPDLGPVLDALGADPSIDVSRDAPSWLPVN